MIRVAVVDDHAIVRRSLAGVLGDCVDLRVVGEFPSATACLSCPELDEVDVLLLDLLMPGCNGMDALPRIREAAPHARVLVFSGLDDELYGPVLLKMGAAGYLSKSVPPGDIAEAIRTVHLGGRVASQPLREALHPGPSDTEREAVHHRLSAREQEVFLHLARGKRLIHVAELMGISIKTASTYRTRILEKMGLTSNTDMTRYALANRLIL
jgi:DNA-binding NarL/FixJ family response regulator